MVIVIKGADFSANNIGTIQIPRVISDFTLNAVTASGKDMSDAEIEALDVFFEKVGAITDAGIWPKLTKVYLPFIGNDVTYGLLNYKTNIKDNTLDSENLTLYKGGVKVSPTITGNLGPSTTHNKIENVNFSLANASMLLLNTENLSGNGIIFGQNMFVSTPSFYYKNFYIENYEETATQYQYYLNNNGTQVFGRGPFTESNIKIGVGRVFGYKNNNTVLKIINSKGVLVTPTNLNLPIVDGQQTIDLYAFSTNNYGNMNKVLKATGAIIIGEYLSDSEFTLLKNQLEALYAVFKEEEEW